MLKASEDKPQERVLDLRGPEGNAFCILGLASDWSKQLGLDTDEILKEMQSSDYKNLVLTFDKYFGSFITIYGSEILDV